MAFKAQTAIKGRGEFPKEMVTVRVAGETGKLTGSFEDPITKEKTIESKWMMRGVANIFISDAPTPIFSIPFDRTECDVEQPLVAQLYEVAKTIEIDGMKVFSNIENI